MQTDRNNYLPAGGSVCTVTTTCPHCQQQTTIWPQSSVNSLLHNSRAETHRRLKHSCLSPLSHNITFTLFTKHSVFGLHCSTGEKIHNRQLTRTDYRFKMIHYPLIILSDKESRRSNNLQMSKTKGHFGLWCFLISAFFKCLTEKQTILWRKLRVYCTSSIQNNNQYSPKYWHLEMFPNQYQTKWLICLLLDPPQVSRKCQQNSQCVLICSWRGSDWKWTETKQREKIYSIIFPCLWKICLTWY